jgi:hypothetical protein
MEPEENTEENHTQQPATGSNKLNKAKQKKPGVTKMARK